MGAGTKYMQALMKNTIKQKDIEFEQCLNWFKEFLVNKYSF